MRIRVGFVALLCACGGGGKTPGDGGDSRVQVVSVPATPNRDLDLLFVIDDSGSMADKQNNLAANFPNFINVLSGLEGGLPNLHLGVVTTDMGTDSSMEVPASPIGQLGQGGCAMSGKNGALQIGSAPVQGKFISDIRNADGTRTKNYTGDLAPVFGQMARVGATGCGFEQPLAAMKAALDNNPANAGFLRSNAILGVMFLGDEDDCSAKIGGLFGPDSPTMGPLSSFRCTRFGVTCSSGGTTPDDMNMVGTKGGCTSNESSTYLDAVAPYADFVKGLKTDPSTIVVGGIIGPVEPFFVEDRSINGQLQRAVGHSCMYTGANGLEVADPGTRFKAFFDRFENRNSFTSVCQPDLSVSLEQLGFLVNRIAGSPCVGRELADVDPNTAGLQVDCIVEDIVGANATVIQKCSSPDTPPCWRLETDLQRCPMFGGLKLVVARPGPIDPTTVTNMRCVVVP